MEGVGHSLRQYRAGGEFVAVRDADLFGRAFAAGERVPWRDMGVHEVQMHQLWRSNIIDCAAPIAVETKIIKPVPSKRR